MRTSFVRPTLLLLLISLPVFVHAQLVIIDSVGINQTNPNPGNYLSASYERYKLVLPNNYDPRVPPPLVIGGHSLGATYEDFFNYAMDDTALSWGWMCLAINGEPGRADGAGYTHWFSERVFRIMDHVLDTVAINTPFNPDSIYFIGGSMGAAAGMQYHHYHLDPNGYMLAGTASGSGIIDLLRRAREQIMYDHYLMNTSMHIEFGPADTVSGPENMNWNYKFNSAVVFWDTTNSRHYNLSWLPTYLAAGIQEHHDTAATDLIALYGRYMFAETLATEPGVQHGFPNLNADTTMHWLLAHGRTFRHPTFQNVATDSMRRCYDIEFTGQRVDTNIIRACATFDSVFTDNQWYLTHPRLTMMRNASSMILHRQLAPGMTYDSIQVTNTDTAAVDLVIEYPNISNASFIASIVPSTYPNNVVLENGGASWHIPQIPRGGSFVGRLGVTYSARDPKGLPEGYTMSIFPNPFNGVATIRFGVPQNTPLDLTVYDVTGRVVKQFPRKFARSQTSVFFSLPSNGLASGSYFIQGKAGNTALHQRITILK